MNNNYKEQTLNNLGIYELRELARKVGVSSPTTKKREDLEREILLINNGELSPTKSSNRGRPPKTISNVDKYLDIFIPKEFIETTLKNKNDERLSNALQFKKRESLDEADNLHSFSGYVRTTSSNYYYFRDVNNYETVISVPEQLVKKYDVKVGDLLVGNARKMTSSDFYILTEILNVNYLGKSKNNLVDIDDIILDDCPLNIFSNTKLGNKVVVVNENFKDGMLKLKDKVLPFQNDFRIVFLAVNISTYTKLLLKKDFVGELIFSSMNDYPQSHYEAVTNAINHVENLMKEGEKVIFVVYDIMGVLNSIESYLALENDKVTFQGSYEAAKIVKTLFNLGRVLSNKGCCTVFTNCLTQEQDNHFYKNDLIKDADVIVNL